MRLPLFNMSTFMFIIKLCNSASTTAVCFYEDLGVLHHDLDDSASESIRNQQSNDEDGGPGLSLSRERYDIEEPQTKRIKDSRD